MNVVNLGEIKRTNNYKKALEAFKHQGFNVDTGDICYWNGEFCYLPDFQFYDEASEAHWAPAYGENEGYTLVCTGN